MLRLRRAIRTSLVGGAGITLMLLHGIFGDAANDGSTDCAKNTVVGLVACKSTCGTTGKCTGETTLALCAWGLLLVITVVRVLVELLIYGGEC